MSSSKPRSVRPHLDVERFELSNGLVVLLCRNHSTPSVSINAVVKTGSRFEPAERAGLASLLGELLDAGTESRTSQEIAEEIESVGGRMATFGDYQSSGATAALMSRDLRLGLDVISDVLIRSVFPEDKVRQRIERRVAQIKSRLDVPRTQASDIFNEIVFEGTPAARPPIGYEWTVKGLSRVNLVEFHRRFYVPNNTLLAIVGDFDSGAVREQVEENFGPWPRAVEFVEPRVPAADRQSHAIDRFVDASKEQVNIFMGHLGIDRRNSDYYALLVMDTILGSSPGFTSRIPRILRDEQGLAYSTFSNITSSAGVDPGRFVAYIGTSPENLEQALAGLRREIARIVAEPVTETEIETAKAYLTGSFVFHFQRNLQIGEFLIDAEVYGLGFDYAEKYADLINGVTIGDLTRVTREYLDPEHMTTVVVGPVGDKKDIHETS